MVSSKRVWSRTALRTVARCLPSASSLRLSDALKGKIQIGENALPTRKLNFLRAICETLVCGIERLMGDPLR